MPDRRWLPTVRHETRRPPVLTSVFPPSPRHIIRAARLPEAANRDCRVRERELWRYGSSRTRLDVGNVPRFHPVADFCEGARGGTSLSPRGSSPKYSLNL